MTKYRRLIPLFLLGYISAHSLPAWADSYALADLKWRYDSNLGNASAPYLVGDAIASAAVTAGHVYLLDAYDATLNLQGKLKTGYRNQKILISLQMRNLHQ